jgi:hypothetical protein
MTSAKTDLLAILAGTDPTQPITAEDKARIEAAVAATEASAPLPDFNANPAGADGVWTTLYSSQGIFGQVPISFMTRAMPGGGADAGSAHVLQIWQEIDMARGFYRNSMMLEAGTTPIHYLATANVAPAPARPNGFDVSFRQMTFAPGAPGVSNEQVRAAIALPEGTPLSIEVADPRPAPANVTYLDEELRINRGKDYVAVLRRVR